MTTMTRKKKKFNKNMLLKQTSMRFGCWTSDGSMKRYDQMYYSI